MNIREAAALHQEVLDLRSFLHEQEQRLMLQWPSEEEPRSPSPTPSLSQRSGVVLFDPSDMTASFHKGTQDNDTKHKKRRPFHLQLAACSNQDQPEQEDHHHRHDESDGHFNYAEEEEGEDEEEEDNQRANDDQDTAEERLRDRAIDEICSTEQSYVAAIRTLHDYYIVPLEDSKHPIMEDAQIAVFFNNLRQLVMLNSKLRNDLVDIVEKRRHGILVPLASPVYVKQERGRSSSSSASSHSGSTSSASSPSRPQEEMPTEGIGAVFCRYAPLFKLYGGYAKDYEQVAQLLQSYKCDSRLGFAQFLQTCQARSGSDESFESLLIKPIQRIPRYKLLLERICEYTRPGHCDELFLKEAVNRVAVAASLINETVRDQENLESVLEAQKKFAGQLSFVTADRRLLRSGKLTKMSTKRREEVMLHLFNDILVYSGVLITGGYRVRRVVQLTSKAVGIRLQIPVTHRSHVRQDCGFVVTSLEKTFVLFAATPEERISWVMDITTAIDNAQQKLCSSSNETPADAAALWVPDAVAGSCSVCHAGFKVFFRRHHCRRCGAVVCGNCSARKSILFVGDSCREERVCTPCYKVLRLVKLVAFKWLSLVVEFKGVLRRKRWNKWSEHYFELKAGILKQYTLASASGLHSKCCIDTLDLTGAIVIHRSDERSLKNRFCFQISTAENTEYTENGNGSGNGSPQSERGSKRLSPLKNWRESTGTSLSSEGSFGSLSKASHLEQLGWVLCASSYSEEMDWSTAVQRSADRALLRARRSRVTECAFPVPFERSTSLLSSSSLLSGINELDEVADDEASKLEHRRYQILKEIVRSEESYIACLGDCIRVFVQPLLLRQLEAQQLLRRKQNKRKKSFLHSLGGSSSSALHAAASLAQRTVSNNNPPSLTSSMRVLSTSNRRGESHGIATTKPLVLDADMAIFFSSIDQLCTLNQQLLEHFSRHLEEIKASESAVERVFRPGAIFSAYAPLFQLYTSYASRHEVALKSIESPQFAVFLKEIPEEASVHRLRTYLNLPMERIPRYKVFLHELLECTPPDHIDYAPLQAAMKSVNQVANKVEEIIARRESARKIDEISDRLGMDLRGKRFVMDGMLKKVCRSKVQQYYFVLLEDALVYGRIGSSLHKKKFRLIELAECKVSDDTESIPRAVNAVTGGCATSNNAFYFFSPLKSFILVALNEEAKNTWMHGIQESIDKTIRGGPRSSRRASIRSELLVDEDELSNDYELENAIVIKNGWLNTITHDNKTSRRMWITLNMQSLSIATMFKSAHLEESLNIELCEAVPMKESTFFRIYVRTESVSKHTVDRRAYTFETQSAGEREEWIRALHHCISGSGMPDATMIEMRRRSLNSASHAPILLFNKVSSVCMICYHSFAVYRPRHHCRLCGSLVCGNCSKRKWTLTYGATKKASRICDGCAEAATGSASSLVSEV